MKKNTAMSARRRTTGAWAGHRRHRQAARGARRGAAAHDILIEPHQRRRRGRPASTSITINRRPGRSVQRHADDLAAGIRWSGVRGEVLNHRHRHCRARDPLFMRRSAVRCADVFNVGGACGPCRSTGVCRYVESYESGQNSPGLCRSCKRHSVRRWRSIRHPQALVVGSAGHDSGATPDFFVADGFLRPNTARTLTGFY